MCYKQYEHNTEQKLRETASNNTNELWKILNDFSNQSKNSSNIPTEVLYTYFEKLNKAENDENPTFVLPMHVLLTL